MDKRKTYITPLSEAVILRTIQSVMDDDEVGMKNSWEGKIVEKEYDDAKQALTDDEPWPANISPWDE